MKNTLASIVLATTTLLPQQTEAVQDGESAIHETLTAQQDIDPVYKDGEIRNGLVFFPSLGFAVNLRAEKITAKNSETAMTTQQFDEILSLRGEETAARYLGGKLYLLRNTETGKFEYWKIVAIDGTYNGETRREGGELRAVREDTPYIELKKHTEDLSANAYSLQEIPLPLEDFPVVKF